MKNIITLIILVLSYCSDHAQNLKGKFMVGGSINYTVSNTTTSDTASNVTHSLSITKHKSMNLSFGVTAGYFVTNRIAVGIIGGYNRITNTYKTNDPLSINYDNESGEIFQGYAAGFFSRYYQPINTSRFSIFCQLSLQRSWIKTSNWYFSYDGVSRNYHEQLNERVLSYSASLNPGIVYFITNKIGLETSFGNLSFLTASNKNYSGGHQTGTSSGTTASLSFALSTLRFGVNVYFSGKTKVVKE